ncbi:hypothetical protein ABG768_016037 [Culter alburnus]|uniref:Uncharacterized protein n=1 Tax=Culter alburnus TaxID=194366 RepID=A0AAW1Z130_CULAL
MSVLEPMPDTTTIPVLALIDLDPLELTPTHAPTPVVNCHGPRVDTCHNVHPGAQA